MRYIVDVGFPEGLELGDEDPEEFIWLLAEANGVTNSPSSGTTFGPDSSIRDIQFEVNDKKLAEKLTHNIARYLNSTFGGFLDEDGQPQAYACCYHEPKNVVVYLLLQHDYKEAWHEFWRFLPWSKLARVDRQFKREHPPHWSELQFTIPAQPGDEIYKEE